MRRNKLNGLTWIGLLIVALGWAILLSGDYLSAASAKIAAPPLPRLDSARLANATIVTGFGLALLGALQQGFGALNRFFDAVLGNLTPPERNPDPMGAEFEAALAQSKPVAATTAIRRPPRPPVRPPGVANYTVREDGTTEVETLLGVRRFNSEKEAREFLGA